METEVQLKILGQLLTGKKDFSGYYAIVRGCRFEPVYLLARLLLDMNFTLTLDNEGEPSVELYTHDDWLKR